MKTRIGLSVCFAALLATHAFAEVPDQLLTSPYGELFGLAPTIGEPKLSPQGDQIIFLQQNAQGVSVLQNLNLADGAVTTLLAGSVEGHDIVWCAFASNTRILCDLRKGLPGFDPEYQRYYVMNADGSDLDEVQRGTGCTARDPLRDTYPIDWQPDDQDHIIFNCGGNVSQFNLNTRRIANIRGAGEVGGGRRLFMNGHGLGNIYRGRITNVDRWFYRDDVETDWVEFDSENPLEYEDPFRPVGYGPDLSRVFNIAWNADTRTWALYSRTLSGDFENRRVVTHPLVDIELVDTLGPYDRVVSVPYIDVRTRRHIVDARVREVHEFITGLLPEVDVEIIDESWDGNIYLARAKRGLSIGEFIVINMANETVQAVGPEYVHLAPFLLTETELVEFTGADGGSISGYLTLPGGTVGRVPAVIIPRSTPSHEDVADPHYLVQFLASSGYAVLRVHNRGPAEYGGGWLPERSVVGWNQTADDVNDAARFLVDSGISEPDAICGLGKNYGAYAALMTAIKYPELLQCIVSISGIADPRSSAGSQRVSSGPILGNDFLDEASPVRRAAEIDPPLLMFQGRNDQAVRMANHAVSLANVLEGANKNFQFIEYVYDTHDIRRGPYRIDMLTRTASFLAEHIGTATTAVPLDEAGNPVEGESPDAGTTGVDVP